MRIEENLPFEGCKSCGLCILDVDDNSLYYRSPDSDAMIREKVVMVRCKNESKCRSNKIKEGMNRSACGE